jgi:hypothetical protein
MELYAASYQFDYLTLGVTLESMGYSRLLGCILSGRDATNWH